MIFRRTALLLSSLIVLFFAVVRVDLERDIPSPRFAVTDTDLRLYSSATGITPKDFLERAGISELVLLPTPIDPGRPEIPARPLRYGLEPVAGLPVWKAGSAEWSIRTQGKVFGPAATVADRRTAVNRYKRAALERKKTLLLVPFYPAFTDSSIFSLIKGTKDTIHRLRKFSLAGAYPRWRGADKSAERAVLLQTPGAPPAVVQIALKFLLVALTLSFLTGRIPISLGFSLPAILIDIVPPVSWAYLILFFGLFADRLVRLARDSVDAPIKNGLLFLPLLLYAGLTLSALGTDPSYIYGQIFPHGVSIAMALAFGLAIYRSARDYPFREPLRLDKSVLFILAAGMLLIALSLRNGPFGSLEARLRETLDSFLLVRPRTRELLLGYPALGVLLVAGRRLPAWFRSFLLLAVSVGVISSLNSFLHFHSFLAISLLRTLWGVLLGTCLGAGLTGVFLLIGKTGLSARLFSRADPR
jgi:hypothetical protein